MNNDTKETLIAELFSALSYEIDVAHDSSFLGKEIYDFSCTKDGRLIFELMDGSKLTFTPSWTSKEG